MNRSNLPIVLGVLALVAGWFYARNQNQTLATIVARLNTPQTPGLPPLPSVQTVSPLGLLAGGSLLDNPTVLPAGSDLAPFGDNGDFIDWGY